MTNGRGHVQTDGEDSWEPRGREGRRATQINGTPAAVGINDMQVLAQVFDPLAFFNADTPKVLNRVLNADAAAETAFVYQCARQSIHIVARELNSRPIPRRLICTRIAAGGDLPWAHILGVSRRPSERARRVLLG